MSYYNIEDILSDSEKIPCVFDLTVPSIGQVLGASRRAAAPTDPSKPHAPALDQNSVAKGTRIDLPFWLGWMLAVSPNPATGSGFASLDFPDALSPAALNALRASPQSVDIRALSAHFYDIGARMLELFDEPGLSAVLGASFRQRVIEITDRAYNPKGALGDGADFLRGLDDSERKVFRSAHDGSKAVRAWLASGSYKQW